MKIMIVGAGWLGLPLAERLQQSGHEVYATTTRAERLPMLTNRCIRALLFHADRDPFPPNPNMDLLVLTIPPGRGTDNVVVRHEARHQKVLRALDYQARIVYLSSTGVYPNTNQRVDESTPPEPVRASGAAMLAGEKVWSGSGLPLTVLRLAGLVGGDRQPGRWFAGKRNISGGLDRVNMVHRHDCLRALERVITDEKLTGVYNICADEHPVRQDFYRYQAEKYSFALPHFSETELRVGHKIVDNEKFKWEARFRYERADPMNF